MITPMLRPDLFGALATHAGDTLYELLLHPDFAEAVRHLRAYDGDICERGGTTSAPGRPFTKAEDAVLLSVLGCSALLLGRPTTAPSGLPFDPRTGVLRERRLAALAGLGPGPDGRRGTPTRCASCGAIWIDAGTRDEYYLDLGAQAFRDGLAPIGVTPGVFELFDAGHGAIEYRYPLAMRFLAEHLAR